MDIYTRTLLKDAEIAKLKEDISTNSYTYELSGCIEAIKPAVIDAIRRPKTVVIARDDVRASNMYNSFSEYSDSGVFFPGKDVIFYQSDIRGNAITTERLKAVNLLSRDDDVTLFMSIEGLINCMPKKPLSKGLLSAAVGDVISLREWSKSLILAGYEKAVNVESSGEYAIRGGIIDIYPLTAETPVRIELFGDVVDSIRTFSPKTQVSIDKIDKVTIDSASEMILTDDDIANGIKRLREDYDRLYNKLREEFKTEEAYTLKKTIEEVIEEIEQGMGRDKIESYMPYFIKQTYTILDYLTKDTLIILDDARGFKEAIDIRVSQFTESMMRRLRKGYILPLQLEMVKSSDEIMGKMAGFAKLIISEFDNKTEENVKKTISINAASAFNYNGDIKDLTKDLIQHKKNHKKVIITCSSAVKAQRLANDLIERDLNAFYTTDQKREISDGEILVTESSVNKGFELIKSGYILISESDIFKRKANSKKLKRKKYTGEKFNSLSEINIGDYVVHENHGVGIYKGLEKIELDGVAKDYIKIEYANKSMLHILASSFDVIQKYNASESQKVKLNKLGSPAWSKTRKSVAQSVDKLAEELIELYALRSTKEGYVYGPDSVWQKEFEDAFMYEETLGQLEAIKAVKKDMESPKIMDRLICGDVGYGKTEVALRAAFKAAIEGKQVVMLCPTTVLAQQHYNTFAERMSGYPVNVRLLSRFVSAKDRKETIEGLKDGSVDIVIATHMALSDKVGYNDLGLLIIDEEQRFGVRHKDKIKQLKKNVDVMCLSATPIPRTLHMSLVGIRDLSLLEEAPLDRHPIQTFVCEYNEETVRDAIIRELNRGGQVYYVYNRVNTIADAAIKIKELVGEANVAYAHGQMSESALENVMRDFVSGDIDILVATTIIEIGMDISNVNTMIIHDAERLGLSQLYQLRGRIGRSERMAYAFFMYKKDKVLKEVATKRLSAIKEFTELGSGVKIALRDLEIRGAGNLLGKEQHGNMEAVGYDLYCKMLNHAIKSKKGDLDDTDTINVEIDIDIDAYIPSSYIADEADKLDMYKRMSDIRDESNISMIQEELTDRFGPVPQSVNNLMYIAKIKCNAYKAYVVRISQKGKTLTLTMHREAKLNPDKIPALIDEYYPYITFSANPDRPEFIYNTGPKNRPEIDDIYEYMIQFLRDLYDIRL